MHALSVSSRSHAILFQFHSFIMSLEWNPSLDHLVVTSIFFSSSMVFLLLFCFSVVIHFFNGLALQWQCSCSCTLQCAQYRSFFFLLLSPKTMIINNNNNNNERKRERDTHTHEQKAPSFNCTQRITLVYWWQFNCLSLGVFITGSAVTTFTTVFTFTVLLTSFVRLFAHTELVCVCMCTYPGMDRKLNDHIV